MGEIDGGVKNIVVIGGGYIGLEAAAVLTKLGCKVTLLEALPRVLARVAGEQLSAFYEKEHRDHGVDLRTGVAVEELVGAPGAEGGRVRGVKLADGTVIPADAVIVGIGIVPAVGALIAAGAAGGNGVDIDEYCRTSLPDIYAIGDCAAFAADYAGGTVMRVESVQNANDQATCVAKAILGDEQPYKAFPWFWSNQYDLRLQTAGLSVGYAGTTMSSIAARLGGSKGTLWSYFPRKEELFAAVLDHATATFRTQLLNILKPCSDVQLSLKRFCEGLMERVTSPESIALHRLVIAEAGRFPEMGEIFYTLAPRMTQDLLSQYLAIAMDERRLRRGNPQDAAWLLVHLCLSGCREQMLMGLIDRPPHHLIEADIKRALDHFMRSYAI